MVQIILGDETMLAGHNMRLLRIQNGLTQQDIADAIGCSKRHIMNYENEYENISDELYLKWINAIYDYKPVHKPVGRPKRKKEAAE